MPVSGPTRVLVDQPLIARLIKLALDHGVCLAREATDIPAATAVLQAWQPHLAVVDMDIGGELLVRGMERSGEGSRTRILIATVPGQG